MTLGLSLVSSFYLLISAPPTTTAVLPLQNPDSPHAVEREWDQFQKSAGDRLRKIRNERAAEATFSSTFESLEAIYADSAKLESWFIILRSTHPDADVREAAAKAELKAMAWWEDLWRDQVLFKTLQSIEASHPDLDPEQNALVKEIKAHFDQAGIDLKSDLREEIEAYEAKLAKLVQKFSTAFAKTSRRVAMTAEELSGVPLDRIARFKIGDDRYLLDFKEWWIYDLVRSYADSEQTRLDVEDLWLNRGSHPQSLKLVGAILRLRSKIAKKSGFGSWMERRLQNLEFDNPRRISRLLRDGLKATEADHRRQQKELTALKRSLTGKPKDKAQSWDLAYLNRIQRERAMQMTGSKVSEYFELEHVLEEALRILTTYVGIEFVVKTDVPVWHPDIRVIELREPLTKSVISHLYLDLFPREGKDTWFFNLAMVPGRLNADQTYQRPVSYIVANFARSAPTLMSFEEVTTLFHELGHALHESLTQSRYSFFSGSQASLDNNEIFSTFFERFVRRPDILRRLARHYVTGEGLSDRAVQALAKTEASASYRESIVTGLVDLRAHQARPAKDARRLYQDFYYPLPFGTDFYSSFSYLEDYDGLYWIYFWNAFLATELEVAEAEGRSGIDLRQGLLSQSVGIRSTRESIERYLERPLRPCKDILKQL